MTVELARSNLRNHDEILRLLNELVFVPVVNSDEALKFLANKRLYGQDLGWVDVRLLASARLMPCSLWAMDKALCNAASEMLLEPGIPRPR